MSNVTESEFVDIGSRMAQELQDCIAEAEQAGCANPFPDMKELIDEWETIFARTSDWKKDIIDNETSTIAALNT